MPHTTTSPYQNITTSTSATAGTFNPQQAYSQLANMTGTTVPNVPTYPQSHTYHDILGRLIEMQKKYIERVEYENAKLKSEVEELKATLNNS
jgi:hypothetical protein